MLFGMTSIQIKDVPEDVHRTIRSRAATAGQSMQEYLRAKLVSEARQPTAAEIFGQIEKDHAGSDDLTADEVVAGIRSERDAR